MTRFNNSERGRSMVEMMGYLAIMMSIIVAIGKIVSNAFDTHKYSTASLQLAELVSSIVKAGAIDVDYGEIITDIKGGENKLNLIPSSYRRAGNKVFHVFGGEVKVDCSLIADSGNDKAPCSGYRVDQFSVTFDHLSKKQCIELAMKNWGGNQYVDLFALKVNDTFWFWPAYGTDSGDDVTSANKIFPVKRALLTGTTDSNAVCKPSDDNVITWVFN